MKKDNQPALQQTHVSRRSSSLNLLVEVDPGSSIERASSDAMELANKLGLTVQFKFNDVLCMALPGGSAADLSTAYFEAQKSKSPYKHAVA